MLGPLESQLRRMQRLVTNLVDDSLFIEEHGVELLGERLQAESLRQQLHRLQGTSGGGFVVVVAASAA